MEVILYYLALTAWSSVSCFVFFHVGDNISQPQWLIRSIRRSNADAKIIMCTDKNTPALEDVNKVYISEIDRSRIMTSRLQSFYELNLQEPAVYLDTDMLVLKPIPIEKIVEQYEVVMCRRDFMRTAKFNTNFKNLDYSEHSGKTLDEVYPYLACFTAARSGAFWDELYELCSTLADKYTIWYGDQEAMRIWSETTGKHRFGTLQEKLIACLPDFLQAGQTYPAVLHFKGAQRKDLMRGQAEKLGLLG